MIDWLGHEDRASPSRSSCGAWPRWRTPKRRSSVRPPPRSSRSSGLTYTASVAGFIFARLALGFGEAGNFPAAIKVTAEWFPKKERALATGLFNSGTNIGALVTPLVVPWITLYWGWYWAFVITGALGFLWLFFWIPLYRSAENITRRSAPPSSRTSAAIRRIRPRTFRGSGC